MTDAYWEALKPWLEPNNSFSQTYDDLSPITDEKLSRQEIEEGTSLWLETLKEYEREALLLLIDDNRNPESLVGSAAREELERRSTLADRKAIRLETRQVMNACTSKQKAKYKARKSKKSK